MNQNIIIDKPVLLLICCVLLSGLVNAQYFEIQTGDVIVSGDGDLEFIYLEVDSSYIIINGFTISVSALTGEMDFNISYLNELGDNRSVGERILDFNVTYSGGNVQFTFTGNSSNDNMLYNLDEDGTRVVNEQGPGTFTYSQSSWSTRSYVLSCGGYQPDPPFNGSSTFNDTIPTPTVNLTWERGNYSNQEVVVGNSNNYPTSPSDGTVWYNGTDLYYNFTVNETQYFTVWSYNSTTNTFSGTGLDIPWGAIRMQCYNETALPDLVGIGFDIQISNSDLSTVYSATDLTNPHYINSSVIPYGVGTLFVVSNDTGGYAQKQYTYDTVVNTFYNLTFWLPQETPSGGGDPSSDDTTDYSENYVITVVGPQGEFGTDPPIEDATVNVKRYINETETYQDVGVYVTDANGQFQIALIPGKTYYFEIIKEGYETEISSWVPPEIDFADDRYHTFRLSPTDTGAGVPTDVDMFWDLVTFTATMEKHIGLDYTGNITIVFDDSNTSTSDTQLKLMEIYGETTTFIGWYNDTSNSWTYTFYGVNITRMHTAVLWINNTASFDVNIPIVVTIPNIEVYVSDVTQSDAQDRAESIVGDLPFGVVGAFAAVFGLIALCAFGTYNTGLGIVMCGTFMGITLAIAGVWLTDPTPSAVALIFPVIIFLGGIYYYTKDPQGHL